MAEHVDDAMRSADEVIAALKRQKPTSAAAARARAVELQRAHEIRAAAAREVVDANAVKRISNGNNGAQPPVQGDEAAALIDALAKGTMKTIATVVKPLKERIAKLEGGARKVETRRALTWICEDASATSDSGRSCDECGSCGPRMRSGPTLLNAVWLAIAKRPAELLCVVCMQQRCRDRLGRELKSSDLRGSDDNSAWLAILGARRHDK